MALLGAEREMQHQIFQQTHFAPYVLVSTHTKWYVTVMSSYNPVDDLVLVAYTGSGNYSWYDQRILSPPPEQPAAKNKRV